MNNNSFNGIKGKSGNVKSSTLFILYKCNLLGVVALTFFWFFAYYLKIL